MTCSPLYHRTSEKRSEFTKLVLASQFPKVPEGTRVDACAVLLMHGRTHIQFHPSSRVLTRRERNAHRRPERHYGTESLLLSDSGFSLNGNLRKITVAGRFIPGFVYFSPFGHVQAHFTHVLLTLI